MINKSPVIACRVSSLLSVLSDHLNAEIAAGTISSKQDAMDYITWTYFFRRLVMNPRWGKAAHTNGSRPFSSERKQTHMHTFLSRSPNLFRGVPCSSVKHLLCRRRPFQSIPSCWYLHGCHPAFTILSMTWNRAVGLYQYESVKQDTHFGIF